MHCSVAPGRVILFYANGGCIIIIVIVIFIICKNLYACNAELLKFLSNYW